MRKERKGERLNIIQEIWEGKERRKTKYNLGNEKGKERRKAKYNLGNEKGKEKD